MAPSATRQKAASGISSGGSVGNDGNSLSSSRGGAIRGLLRSLRSGRSTESGSPRSSRTGFGEGPVTPRGSHSQNVLAAHLESLRPDSDKSDSECVAARRLSSDANGRTSASFNSRQSIFQETGHIELPLEVSLAASRSYSGRQSIASAGSSRQSFESPLNDITAHSRTSAGCRGVRSGPAPLVAMAADVAAAHAVRLLSGPGPNAPPQSAFAAAIAAAMPRSSHPEDAELAPPGNTVTCPEADVPPVAEPEQQQEQQEQHLAVAPPAPSLLDGSTPLAEPMAPWHDQAPQPSPEIHLVRPATRTFQPSIRRRLLEATVNVEAVTAAAVPASFLPPQQTVGSRAPPSRSGDEGVEEEDEHDGADSGLGSAATAGDEIIAACSPDSGSGGGVGGGGGDGATALKGKRRTDGDGSKQDTQPGNPAPREQGQPPQDPQQNSQRDPQQQEQQQDPPPPPPQQQRHLRSASTNALSAMAVSQAVQRLQMRQQQEKAAARFLRTSTHAAVGGGGSSSAGSGVLPPQWTSSLPHSYHGGAPGSPQSQSHAHSHSHMHSRDIVATASTHRVLSVASDSSGGSGGGGGATGTDNGDHGTRSSWGRIATAAATTAAAATAVGGGVLSSNQLSSQVNSHLTTQSPARRLGLGQSQSRSAASNFVFQHALYDSHRAAFAAGTDGGAGAVVPRSDVVAAPRGGHARGAGNEKDGLDAWLGDVPDMSKGRMPRSAVSDFERGRSSASFTEGHVSAAERLQAMLNSAASVGGDDAASYLQQLLIPDVPSTASADLQYSAASTRVPSVVALAYGSSSGAGAPTAAASATPVGGVWGMVHGGSPRYAGYGDPCPVPTSPFICTAVTGALTTSGGAHVRHLSAQGHAIFHEHGSRASYGAGSSGPSSRAGSVIITPHTGPQLGGGISHTSTATGGMGIGTGIADSITSGSATSTPDPGACGTQHAGKTSEQLIEELRALYATTGCGGGGGGGGGNGSRAASGGARVEAVAAAFGVGDVPEELCGGGADDIAAAAAAAATAHQHQQQQQQRDALVAALWRLLRSKDSEAVSYLLRVDPGGKANRHIAPVLQEMRSWVYTNMW